MCCIQSARACVCVCVEWCWVWHERFHSRGRSFGSSSPCIFRVCSEFRERASARAGHKLLRRRKFRVKVRVLVFTDVYREVSGLTKVWTKAYTFLFLSVLMELFRVYVCGNVWISSVCLALPENWLEKQIVRSRFSGFIPYGKYFFCRKWGFLGRFTHLRLKFAPTSVCRVSCVRVAPTFSIFPPAV